MRYRERGWETEKVREKKRKKYLERGSTEHRSRAICNEGRATSNDKVGWGERQAMRMRRSEQRRRASKLRATWPWVWFALYWGFIYLFIFINSFVLEFVFLLLCVDCIRVWFSLPMTWPWVWFLILYIGFFFLRIYGFATSVIY